MAAGNDRNAIILLIENSSAHTESFYKVLNNAGYKAFRADSAAAALEILKNENGISLVIIETGSGQAIAPAETAKQILEYKELPLLLLAGPCRESDDRTVMDIPHYGFITRNSGESVIRSSIENAIKLNRVHSATADREKYYHKIFDSSSEPLFLHDLNTGRIIDVNRTMLEMFGYIDKNEVIGKSAGDFSAVDEGYTGDKASELIGSSLEHGRNIFEWRARRRNGETFWAEVMLTPVNIGNEVRVLASVRDISDRKAAEDLSIKRQESLVEQQRFSQMLLDTSPAFICAVDANGRILMMNRSFLDALEYSMDELKGADYLDVFIPVEDREFITGIFSEIFISGEIGINHTRIKSRSGRIFLVEWYGQLVKNGIYNTDFFVGIGIDVTAKKQAEMEILAKNEELTAVNEEMEAANEELIAANYELQAAEQRYRGVVETQTEMIARFDYDGRITFVNRGWKKYYEEYLGIKDDVTGMNIRDLMQLKNLSEVQAYLDTLNPGELSAAMERSFVSVNGETRWQLWYIQKLVEPYSGVLEFQVVGNDITDRKLMELELVDKNQELTAVNEEMEATNEELMAINSELQVAEEKYRGVVESQTEMIARFLPDGRITFVNMSWRKYYEEHLGIKEDVTGKTIQEVVKSDSFSQIMAYLDTLEPGYRTTPNERSFTSIKGDTLWQRWYIQKIFEPYRNRIEYQVVGTDITEQKNAEISLRESESRFKSLIDLAPDAIMLGDQHGIIVRANHKATELAGYPNEELLGRSVNILFTDEDLKKSPLRYDLLKEGKVVKSERVLTRKDGSTAFIEMNTRMMPDGEYLTFIRDITERKLTEELISEEKERLSVTLRSIGDGVITTDIKGNVVIMNRVAEDLTGWSQRDAEGRPFTEIFKILNEFTGKPCANPVDFVLETGKNIELSHNTVLISRDGAERIIADSCAPIKDRSSVTIGVVLVFRDMTEKRRLIDAVQQTDKLNSLGVLAGGIAHDFNNLLSGIFGYMEMARLKSSPDQAVTGYIDKAFTVFNRARDLTQQLLTFSKGGTPVKKTGDIRVLLKESSTFALSGSNVMCNYAFDDNLMLCDYDENQMGQVIDNIVINAKQAMPGGGSVTIQAVNRTLRENENPFLNPGNYIEIKISDTGTGIAPELVKKIFDPFFTTKQHGNGLGLATTYSIIQKHEGFIGVDSVQGEGTTFTVLLPASGKTGEASAISGPASHEGRGTILVMDDEDFIREVAGDMLSFMGYAIVYARNGEEAIRLFDEAESSGKPIDAAIFDLTIPGGMGGRETAAEIRKKNPFIPIFASSGFSEDHIMSHPEQYGFTASIRKPYRKDEIADLLNRHIGKTGLIN